MDARGNTALAAPKLHAAHGVEAQPIDVSNTAQAVLFCCPVLMDAEAFGVTVTRRDGARPDNLSADERTRLLDVLCHAQGFQTQAFEREHRFPIWIVSSDARDARHRTHWLVLARDPLGRFLITLSDV